MGMKNIIKKWPTMLLAAKYAKHFRRNKVDETMIFYSAHQGAGMLCGPYAIFRRLMESRLFDSFVHVWQINDAEEKKMLESQIKDEISKAYSLVVGE